MTNRPSAPLLDRLLLVSDLWIAAQGASRAKLGRLVVNDGGFFTRLASQPRGTTTETLDRFARFFADEASWPDGGVPAEARVEVAAFCHVNGVSVSWGDPATGSESGASPPSTAPLLEAGASHPPTAPLLEAGSRDDIGEAA